MKLLLDTHTLIWWDSQSTSLSASALSAINDPANEVWFSVVNIWEMAIKVPLGKLTLNVPLDQLARQQLSNGLLIADVDLDHVLTVEQLPLHHRDPFDRMLLAQAICMKATIISVDPLLSAYNVPVLW